jgi:hypothetical protein
MAATPGECDSPIVKGDSRRPGETSIVPHKALAYLGDRAEGDGDALASTITPRSTGPNKLLKEIAMSTGLLSTPTLGQSSHWLTTRGIRFLVAVTLAAAGTLTYGTQVKAEDAQCWPRLVRATTYFPPQVRQFQGDGVVELGVEVDRTGRVTGTQVKSTRASAALYAAASVSATREWLFDVTSCSTFPARTTVRVEYQRPAVYTLAGTRARSQRLAAALPTNADCIANETPKLADDRVVSCLMRGTDAFDVSSPATTAANEAVVGSRVEDPTSPADRSSTR